MQRIKRLVRPTPDMQALNWKAAIPVLGLAATLLVGCAQTPVADSAADAVTTPPLAQFNSCAKPMYPAEALAKRLQGTVTLQFKVEADGSVQDSKVMKSSGDASLDEAARVAIAKCTFTPATVNGRPKAAWAPVQYVWSVD